MPFIDNRSDPRERTGLRQSVRKACRLHAKARRSIRFGAVIALVCGWACLDAAPSLAQADGVGSFTDAELTILLDGYEERLSASEAKAAGSEREVESLRRELEELQGRPPLEDAPSRPDESPSPDDTALADLKSRTGSAFQRLAETLDDQAGECGRVSFEWLSGHAPRLVGSASNAAALRAIKSKFDQTGLVALMRTPEDFAITIGACVARLDDDFDVAATPEGAPAKLPEIEIAGDTLERLAESGRCAELGERFAALTDDTGSPLIRDFDAFWLRSNERPVLCRLDEDEWKRRDPFKPLDGLSGYAPLERR